MKTAQGSIEEIFLDGSARIACPPDLIPAPGQYLAAHANASDSPLPVSVFPSLPFPNGFRAARPLPASWRPGDKLNLRGPIGHGFILPASARKVVLVAFDDSPSRLRGLISASLKQSAEVVVICDSPTMDLPEEVEVQPLGGLVDALQWADYSAMDILRENLDRLKEMLVEKEQITAKVEAQVLVRVSMPCVALGDCGVCALALQKEWKMICKDGPVFQLKELL